MKYQNYHKIVKMLRQNLPPRCPVSVRRIDAPKGEYGHCQKYNKRYSIIIDKRLPEWLAIEVLLHEWAHCLSWSEKADHGDKWGVAYSRTYREFLKFKESMHKTKHAAKIFAYFNI